MSQQARESRREIQQGDIVRVDDSRTDDFNPEAYGISVHAEYRVARIESDRSLYLRRNDEHGSEIGPVRACFFERVLRSEAPVVSKDLGKNRPVLFGEDPLESPAIHAIDLPFSFGKETLMMVSLRQALEEKLDFVDPRTLSPYRKLILTLARIYMKPDCQFRLAGSLSSPYVSSYAALRSVERKMMVRELFDALECELIRRNYKEILDIYDGQFSPVV